MSLFTRDRREGADGALGGKKRRNACPVWERGNLGAVHKTSVLDLAGT